jgi:hypothetical protein
MNLSLSYSLGRSMVYTRGDADALAYIAAVEGAGTSVSATQKTAINDFYVSAKADSYYTSLKRLYLPIWASAAANAIDMIGLTSGTFNGGVTHGAGYVQGNGTTGYFDFGVDPNTLGISSSGGMIGILVNQAPTLSGRRFISAQSGATPSDILDNGANLQGIFQTGAAGSSLSLSLANMNGVITHIRENSASQRISTRKTVGVSNATIETTAASGTIANDLVALARNTGTISGWSDCRAGAYFAANSSFKYANENDFTLALKDLWETATSLTLP